MGTQTDPVLMQNGNSSNGTNGHCENDENLKANGAVQSSNGHLTNGENGTVACEIVDLPHIKRDFFEQSDTAVVVLYLKNVVSNSVKVIYEQQSFTLMFRTTDETFLENYGKPTAPETIFRWGVEKLRGEIVPSSSSFHLTDRKLEIRLKKTEQTKWNRVDFDASQSSSVPSPQLNQSSSSSQLQQPASPSITISSVSSASNSPSTSAARPIPPKISLDDSAVSAPKSSPDMDISSLHESAAAAPSSSSLRGYRTRLGMRGLVNQSNNCYQNAVIQILANSPHLRDYCLSRFDEDADINRTNPLGSKGKMVVEFVKLIHDLWSSSSDSRLAPVDTAQSVGLVAASRFRPFFQHDAQEFVTYLLDTIHEDLNKGYGRPPLKNGGQAESESNTSESAWATFLHRNESPLVDMFYGQICNKITCQHCFKESNAYDPFMMLPLPIARPSRSVDITCLYVPTPLSPRDQPVRIQLSVPSCVTSEEIKQAVRSHLNTSHVTCELKLYALQPVPPSSHSLVHFWRASDVHALTRLRWAAPKNGVDVLIYETQSAASVGGPKKQQSVIVHVVQMLSTSQQSILECAYCRKKAEKSDLPRCTRCQAVAYCGTECQRAHWKAHKGQCVPFEQSIGLPLCFTVSISVSWEKFLKMVETGVKRFVDGACQSDSNHAFKNHVAFELAPDDSHDSGDQKSKKKEKAANKEEKVPVGQANFQQVLSETASTGHVLKLRLLWLNGRAGACRLQMSPVPLAQYEAIRVVVPVSQDRVSLNDCFRLYFEPELMHSANAWMCPACKKNRTAIQRSLISRYPRYLICYIKRFSQDGYVHKDREHVLYPSVLDVSSFVADEALPASSCVNSSQSRSPTRQRQTSTCAPQQIAYHLYGVVNHYGTMQFGHYSSYGRLPRLDDAMASDVPWRLFDDELVEETSASRVVDMPDAYILFYQLAEEQAPTPKTVTAESEKPEIEVEEPKPSAALTEAAAAIVGAESEEEDDESVEDLEDAPEENGKTAEKLSVGMSDLLLNDDTVD